MKVVLSLVFLSIAISVAYACDKGEVKRCSQETEPRIQKLKQEASSAVSQSDKDRIMKELCKLMGDYALCLRPALKGCPKNEVNIIEKLFNIFNGDPFNCNINLNAAGLISATLLVTAVSAIVAIKFY